MGSGPSAMSKARKRDGGGEDDDSARAPLVLSALPHMPIVSPRLLTSHLGRRRLPATNPLETKLKPRQSPLAGARRISLGSLSRNRMANGACALTTVLDGSLVQCTVVD